MADMVHEMDLAVSEEAEQWPWTSPLTKANWSQRWQAANAYQGWRRPRAKLEELLKSALLDGRTWILCAPTGWGKTGVWKLAWHILGGRPVVVIHPLVSVGIDGFLEAGEQTPPMYVIRLTHQ